MQADKSNEKPQIQKIEQEAHQVARKETAARPVRRMRTILFQLYLLLALLGFSALAFLASSAAYFPIDVTITRGLQILDRPWLDFLMRAISWPGYTLQAGFVIIAVAVLLYIYGFHWESVMSVGVAVGEEVLNYIIKIVVHRPRPSSNLVHVFSQLGSYSFPSGHVMFYTVYFGFLFFLFFTLLKASIRRTIYLIVTGGLVILIGISRIYLGEHWASDVLGGYLAGSLALIAAVLVYRWGKPLFFARQPVAPEPVEPTNK